jgi:thiol-disulfide isomerase/thioredoxin
MIHGLFGRQSIFSMGNIGRDGPSAQRAAAMPVNGSMRLAVVFSLAGILGFVLLQAPVVADEASPAPIGGELKNFVQLRIPQPVPDISFKDGAGRDLNLSAFKGQVLLVNLWATWCAPCRAEMPALDRLQAALGGPDFKVVAVAEDRADTDKVRAFLEQIEAKHLSLYVDNNVRAMREWGVFGLPTTFLLDREGREVGRLTGPAAWDSEDAKRLIRHFIDAK